ncbi:hypothetical protein N7463_004235 [Penicillium fimorum]|uniref:Retrotransposon gag domain-containing protein n=1 Tax=Penicillium fimorum TaxID=1882269 RepID=A0A9W9XK78_9EURO|nr:hypothetical protein N7463_010455 [Penicillium fimorum]KAJ5497587.1 hypothetical protein N7463_009574 [Penicillium fimorum]KAJ5514683.1 hypothetical protein N7463_004235 [Penicillium fimorum]
MTDIPTETPKGAPEAPLANDAMARIEAMMIAMMASVEQRIHQIEEAVQVQNRTPSELTAENTRTKVEATNTIGPHVETTNERNVTTRPRAVLPNPAMFSGSTTDWPAWRILVENKLRVDGICLGSPADQCAYIYSRLEKMALKNTSTFMRERRDTGTPDDLLAYLERIYGDPNVKARAVQRLYALKQKPTQSFEKFLPSFERELADAGALQWPDDSKIHTLVMALNKETHSALVHRGIPSNFTDLVHVLHRISADLSGFQAMWGQTKRTLKAAPVVEDIYEPMDWTPTVNMVKANRFAHEPSMSREKDRNLMGKRAKWVEQGEMDRRREEGLCLRCGRSGCRIATCPLKPARRPEEQKQRINANKAGKTRRNGPVSAKKSDRHERDLVVESSSETEFTTASESSESGKE